MAAMFPSHDNLQQLVCANKDKSIESISRLFASSVVSSFELDEFAKDLADELQPDLLDEIFYFTVDLILNRKSTQRNPSSPRTESTHDLLRSLHEYDGEYDDSFDSSRSCGDIGTVLGLPGLLSGSPQDTKHIWSPPNTQQLSTPHTHPLQYRKDVLSAFSPQQIFVDIDMWSAISQKYHRVLPDDIWTILPKTDSNMVPLHILLDYLNEMMRHIKIRQHLAHHDSGHGSIELSSVSSILSRLLHHDSATSNWTTTQCDTTPDLCRVFFVACIVRLCGGVSPQRLLTLLSSLLTSSLMKMPSSAAHQRSSIPFLLQSSTLARQFSHEQALLVRRLLQSSQRISLLSCPPIQQQQPLTHPESSCKHSKTFRPFSRAPMPETNNLEFVLHLHADIASGWDISMPSARILPPHVCSTPDELESFLCDINNSSFDQREHSFSSPQRSSPKTSPSVPNQPDRVRFYQQVDNVAKSNRLVELFSSQNLAGGLFAPQCDIIKAFSLGFLQQLHLSEQTSSVCDISHLLHQDSATIYNNSSFSTHNLVPLPSPPLRIPISTILTDYAWQQLYFTHFSQAFASPLQFLDTETITPFCFQFIMLLWGEYTSDPMTTTRGGMSVATFRQFAPQLPDIIVESLFDVYGTKSFESSQNCDAKVSIAILPWHGFLSFCFALEYPFEQRAIRFWFRVLDLDHTGFVSSLQLFRFAQAAVSRIFPPCPIMASTYSNHLATQVETIPFRNSNHATPSCTANSTVSPQSKSYFSHMLSTVASQGLSALPSTHRVNAMLYGGFSSSCPDLYLSKSPKHHNLHEYHCQRCRTFVSLVYALHTTLIAELTVRLPPKPASLPRSSTPSVSARLASLATYSAIPYYKLSPDLPSTFADPLSHELRFTVESFLSSHVGPAICKVLCYPEVSSLIGTGTGSAPEPPQVSGSDEETDVDLDAFPLFCNEHIPIQEFIKYASLHADRESSFKTTLSCSPPPRNDKPLPRMTAESVFGDEDCSDSEDELSIQHHSSPAGKGISLDDTAINDSQHQLFFSGSSTSTSSSSTSGTVLAYQDNSSTVTETNSSVLQQEAGMSAPDLPWWFVPDDGNTTQELCDFSIIDISEMRLTARLVNAFLERRGEAK